MSRIISKALTINRKEPANYVAGELDFCAGEFCYQTYDIELLKIRNCLVTHEGAMYQIYSRLVEKSLVHPSHRDRHQVKEVWKRVIRGKRKFLFDAGPYLVGFDGWSSSHYHWFCDLMPRLYSIKAELPAFTFILPDTAYIRNVGLKSFELFGIKPKNLVWVAPDEVVVARSCFLITHTCLTGQTHDPIIRKMKQDLNQKLGLVGQQGKRKLYISRESAAYRKVLNEQEVQALFTGAGYEVVRFEEFSFGEQVHLASQTGVLASIHGAGLTNMLFMPSGSKVAEFRRGQVYHNQCYWHLADALSHRYYYLFGQPDSADVIEGNGCNLTLPLAKVERLLQDLDSHQPILAHEG